MNRHVVNFSTTKTTTNEETVSSIMYIVYVEYIRMHRSTLTAVNAHVWFLLDNVAFILELRTFQDANESNGARSQAFRSTVLHIKILSWNVYRNS